MGRIALIRDAVGGGRLREHGNALCVQALVDVELVGPAPALYIPRVRDMDVEPSVAVDVDEGDARRPGPLAGDPCPFRYVREAEPALVQVESVLPQVRGEQQLRKSVAREVPQRHAAAVVEVAVLEDVMVGCLDDPVFESNARIAGGKLAEELIACRGGLTRPGRPVRAGEGDTDAKRHNRKVKAEAGRSPHTKVP